MTVSHSLDWPARMLAFGRIVAGVLAIAVLAYSYGEQRAAGRGSPLDFLGYFTNQTSLLTAILLMVIGALALAGRIVPAWLTTARAVATTCLLVVAVVYNVLVPGAGAASAWVSAALHVIFPCLVVLDWLIVPDRQALPWRQLWLVLPYPLLWLGVVLVRGVTDGWVPYGFLLPEHGLRSLGLHVTGLLVTFIAAGALVWAVSRFPGLRLWRRVPREAPVD